MTTCPFCREAIAEGAIKCRHCQSYLVPIAAQAEPKPAETGDGRVTYVLDQGLVYFGKFVAGALAIFVVFGVYMFGLKLEDAFNEMRKAEDKLREVDRKVEQTSAGLTEKTKELERAQFDLTALAADYRQAMADLEQAKVTAQKAVAEANGAVLEVRKMVAQVETDSNQARVAIVEFRNKTLSGQQEVLLAEIKTGNPGKFRGGGGLLESKLWPVGKTLRVRFLDGDPALRAQVAAAVVPWTESANIRFEFDSAAKDAEVRVSFAQQGSWAFVGTDALALPNDQPTVNLGFPRADSSDDLFAETALHEFGHVLGLYEEMSNPNGGAELDMELIRQELSRGPDARTSQQIDFIFGKKERLKPYRQFDPESVMMARMPQAWFKNPDARVKTTSGLSPSDKQFIAELYPKA